MAEVNWELIIFIIIAGLIIFAAMGVFVGTRISSDKRRVRELEDELMQARKDLEAYRTRVNTHFKKTSELFTQMTDSYKSVYMHLAEGAQELCSTDVALLKPANAEFMKVTYEREKQAAEPAGGMTPEKPVPAAEEKTPQPAAGAADFSDVSQQVQEGKQGQQQQAPAEPASQHAAAEKKEER